MSDLQLAKEREKQFEGEARLRLYFFSFCAAMSAAGCLAAGGARLALIPPLVFRLADWREKKGLAGGMDMNVTVLTTGFWPTYKVRQGWPWAWLAWLAMGGQ